MVYEHVEGHDTMTTWPRRPLQILANLTLHACMITCFALLGSSRHIQELLPSDEAKPGESLPGNGEQTCMLFVRPQW